MNNNFALAAFMFTLVIPQSVIAAETVNTQVIQTEQGDSSAEKIILSESDLIRARLWDLSEVEWHRYKQLMQGIRGSISPATISRSEERRVGKECRSRWSPYH